jgi:hypothetical protein
MPLIPNKFGRLEWQFSLIGKYGNKLGWTGLGVLSTRLVARYQKDWLQVKWISDFLVSSKKFFFIKLKKRLAWFYV